MLESLAFSASVALDDGDFLAQFYQITSDADWQLDLLDGCYQLNHTSEQLSLKLDFNNGNYRHRNEHPAKEPLAKAIKIKQKLPETLIDATPGVLKDSLMLAGRGVRIIAIERNPLVFVMVRRALTQMQIQPTIDYHFGDAGEKLADYNAEAIYLDPMYPPKKKNAQVKKDMQVLHRVIGADSDAKKLFESARQQNVRVIVKRPSYAEPIANCKPSFVSQTGATRFDVYLPTR